MKTVLYLGTDPTAFISPFPETKVIHYPLISIVPRSLSDPNLANTYANLSRYTHILFTSKYGVEVFFSQLALLGISPPLGKSWIAIGKRTASFLEKEGFPPSFVAQEESQEGVIALLQTLPSSHLSLLIPKSSLSRPVLYNFLIDNQIDHTPLDIYDTQFQQPSPPPSWNNIDLFVFTSPSTVRAFVHFFGKLPDKKKCYSIGPITQLELDSN